MPCGSKRDRDREIHEYFRTSSTIPHYSHLSREPTKPQERPMDDVPAQDDTQLSQKQGESHVKRYKF
jgi:hypothetical protein